MHRGERRYFGGIEYKNNNIKDIINT